MGREGGASPDGKVENDVVAVTMTIGDFSRATRLSAKTLRFYHQVGLLEPAWVDPVNSYRVYAVEQIADAQVIRHFRALDMPVDLIRNVLAAPDLDDRNTLIAGHLARMETQLEATRSVVASLRGLLTTDRTPLAVSHRHVAATPAFVIRELIDLDDLGRWYTVARRDLDDAVAAGTLATGTFEPSGPPGGIWDTELFLNERGVAAVFRPISALEGAPLTVGRAAAELLPAVDLAVTVHHGSDDTLAQVYGALGDYVSRHELSIDGPIREVYLQDSTGPDGYATTEIGWPIVSTEPITP
jgi:DNA-binding transcriptional MerR regulator